MGEEKDSPPRRLVVTVRRDGDGEGSGAEKVAGPRWHVTCQIESPPSSSPAARTSRRRREGRRRLNGPPLSLVACKILHSATRRTRRTAQGVVAIVTRSRHSPRSRFACKRCYHHDTSPSSKTTFVVIWCGSVMG